MKTTLENSSKSSSKTIKTYRSVLIANLRVAGGVDVEPGKRDVDEVDAEAEPTEGREKGRTEEAHKVVVAEGGAGVGGGAVEQPGGDEDEGEVEGDHEQGHVPGVVVVQLEQRFVVGGLVEPGKEQRDDGEDEEADVPAVADDRLKKGERELEYGIFQRIYISVA